MSNIDRTSPTPSDIVGRFDHHVQVFKARLPETLEEFWLQTVLEDRAESAVPPPALRWTPRNV